VLACNRHHDDVGLVRQREERVAVLRGQVSEGAPPPLVRRDVQAEYSITGFRRLPGRAGFAPDSD
jgi:hypothetical protein